MRTPCRQGLTCFRVVEVPEPGELATPAGGRHFTISRSFGHDLAFALGLFFLGIVFYPILAFGGDTYQGPALAS
jgi:hypothetical protein